MAESLQEQLLKAGLVTREQARKTQVARRKKAKRGRGGRSVGGAGGDQAEAQRRLQKAAEEKAGRDRELNRQRTQAAERRALVAQVRQMIETHRLPREDAGVAYNFADGGRIKKIQITTDMRAGLAEGRLTIVRLGDGYEVVPVNVAQRIQERDPDVILVWNQAGTAVTRQEEDEYAQYQVPDDLMW